ncbi:DNA-binding GntR family transcriptional regulator [Nocardia sp. GAS34]|uniref:GntR family transcriptional regulator n=1 Tax=unclassified Nocardia TaxID=2637762 RepID=UPI003D1DB274
MAAEAEMTALRRIESLAERAYRALREQIAVGGLAPGERLTERGLGMRLGVSASPIREALRRLEQERLVERVSPRQVRVAEHSEESLRELMYVEALLRAVAVRFATTKIAARALEEMTVLVDELEHDPRRVDPERQLVLARRFDELTSY